LIVSAIETLSLLIIKWFVKVNDNVCYFSIYMCISQNNNYMYMLVIFYYSLY